MGKKIKYSKASAKNIAMLVKSGRSICIETATDFFVRIIRSQRVLNTAGNTWVHEFIMAGGNKPEKAKDDYEYRYYEE